MTRGKKALLIASSMIVLAAIGAGIWIVALTNSRNVRVSVTESVLTHGSDRSENSVINSIYCYTGGCVAVGSIAKGAIGARAFLAVNTGGMWKWKKALAIGLSTNDSASLDDVSCTDWGSCIAGGAYSSGLTSSRAFVIVGSRGHWSSAREVDFPGSDRQSIEVITSTTCVGDACYALASSSGNRLDDAASHAVVIEEIGGQWLPNHVIGPVEGQSNVVEPTQIACAARGACWIVGYDVTARGSKIPFVVGQEGGHWSSPHSVATSFRSANNALDTVSCISSVECVAAGNYTSPTSGKLQAYTVRLSFGIWGNGTSMFPSGPESITSSVSSIQCLSADRCIELGYSRSADDDVFIRDDNAHTEPRNFEIGGNRGAEAGQIACGTSSLCVVVGSVQESSTATSLTSQAFVKIVSGNSWSETQVITLGAKPDTWSGLTSVSCVARWCYAGGFETIDGQQQGVAVQMMI